MNKEYFDIAIAEANKSLENGSFPVGAVLLIDGLQVDSAGNTSGCFRTRFEHAETLLVQKYAEEIFKATVRNAQIELYTTVEPCLQCLGIAVINRITHIYYMMPDPHGGACNLDRKSLGRRFHDVWPVIEQVDYRILEQRELIKKYIELESSRGHGDFAQRLQGVLK